MKKVKNILIIVGVLIIPFAFFIRVANVALFDHSSAMGVFLKPRRMLGMDLQGYPSEDKIKFVGCGLPKTGTSSIELAINELGYNVYHVRFGLLKYPNHLNMWVDAMRDPEKNLPKIIDEVLRLGYNGTGAGTFGPLCMHIHRLYPDAKVVLSVRDSAEQWTGSYLRWINSLSTAIEPTAFPWTFFFDPFKPLLEQFYKFLSVDFEVRYHDSILPWVPKFSDGISFPDESQLLRAYDFYNAKVMEEVDNEKMLVHNPKEGWGPLVEFFESSKTVEELGPYPHVNAKGIWLVIRYFFRYLKWWPLYILAVVIYVSYVAIKIREFVKYGL